MKVYHTSDRIVNLPDTLHSRAALDFGRGFYVTPLYSQAVRYGERFRIRNRQAYLNIYELADEWRHAKVKIFPHYDTEWLDVVMANRREQVASDYDAVEGGIANDRIFRTFDLYSADEISREEALKRLRFEQPNHQICFLKQEIMDKYLTYIGSERL